MSNITLDRVAQMVDMMRNQQERVRALTEDLAREKTVLREIETVDLPELMREVGLSECKLTDGTKVTISDEVECHISEERMPAAVAWLTQTGNDGIIKTEVRVAFGRDERADAVKFAEDAMRTEGTNNVDLRNTIAPQTLKAFIKDQINKNVAVPFDVFGVQPFSRAKLKAPRER